MAEQEISAPALQEEDLAVLKLRIKNEAHLTSSLGYGNAKKRELEVFNAVVWPRLTEEGWCKVRRRFNNSVFDLECHVYCILGTLHI